MVPAWALDPGAHRVERYVLGPELGRGGMGRVHLGWDPMLRRLVAIKLLLGDDPELHLRLLREARNQAKIEHPNVCRIHDLGMDGNRPYIAMQLILGNSLAELRPELDHRHVAELLADVAGAVHAAHKVGLIHRDLKPANILVCGRALKRADKARTLLDSGGVPRFGSLQAYVVDFGLARDLQALDQTLSWAVMGTPAFMSPEQARGEALGPATDIYSLGATLYAMLTGKPPYEGATLAGLITQQSERGVRALRKLEHAVPRDLETIALKCLEAEPARRYGTALELEQDLRRWLAGEPIAARPVGPVGRLWRWARRKPTLAGTAAAGLLATLVLGGWNLRTAREGRQREAAAQRFALEIRDAEHLLRIERMMPVHDIRPAEARLRGRMESIRREMGRLGGLAQGPGLYALGRGHLALREFDAAIQELDQAWTVGYQAPEVAFARALARLRAYERQVMADRLGRGSAAAPGEARSRFVLPALHLLRDAQGASVDSRDYGYALAAMASERHQEAEDGFRSALVQAPWLAEAWVGMAQNLFLRKWGDNAPLTEVAEVSDRIQAMLESATRLAPSDDEALLAQVQAKNSWYIRQSAHSERSERPLVEATELLARAKRIRPDLPDLDYEAAMVATQRGFYQLSAGADPGAMARATIGQLEASLGRAGWRSPAAQTAARLQLHHLWWIVAEADWRFGRDPQPALVQAAAVRKHYPGPEAHFVFANLVQARHRISRGEDPSPWFEESERFLAALAPLDLFHRSIQGELVLEWSTWLVDRGQDPEARIASSIEALERSARENPAFAYTYYALAPLHALRARCAMRAGRNPSGHVAAAQEAARKGLAANPGNVNLRLAAAEAALLEAEERAARAEEVLPALEKARRHVEAFTSAGFRDFRPVLVMARVEWGLASASARRGADPTAALERLEATCRRGLSIKRDEPRFHLFLARAAVARANRVQGLAECRKALSICPNLREGLELQRSLTTAG